MTKEVMMNSLEQMIENGSSFRSISSLIRDYRITKIISEDYHEIVCSAVSIVCGLTMEQIKSKSREGARPIARRLICHILADKKVSNKQVYSDEFLAEMLNFDRTSAIYNKNKGRDNLGFDVVYTTYYENVIQLIENFEKNEKK